MYPVLVKTCSPCTASDETQHMWCILEFSCVTDSWLIIKDSWLRFYVVELSGWRLCHYPIPFTSKWAHVSFDNHYVNESAVPHFLSDVVNIKLSLLHTFFSHLAFVPKRKVKDPNGRMVLKATTRTSSGAIIRGKQAESLNDLSDSSSPLVWNNLSDFNRGKISIYLF